MAEKILLVDDQPDAITMLGLALRAEGYHTVGALSGSEALQKIELDRPDLVILDILMPGMDGFEVCRRIRQGPETAQLPIIMVTALAQEDEKVAGFEAGADDYMVKPVSLRELCARVRALLARSSLAETTTSPPREARILAFAGVKGGVGTTTLAVNTAIAATQEGTDAILVDLHPHGGSVAAQLGDHTLSTLGTLLEQEPETIEPDLLESCLLSHPSGMRVLPAGLGSRDQPHELTAQHVETIVSQLASQADLLVLDLGCVLNLATQTALRRATRVALVSEADHIALRMAHDWLGSLKALGIRSSLTSVVVVNRGGAAPALTKAEIEEVLNSELLALIFPEPDQCLLASKRGVPVLLMERDSRLEMQLESLARSLLR